MAAYIETGKKIKEIREKAGLNQDQIAKFLNIDQTYVSKIENGERQIPSEILEKLSNLFGCTLHDLLNTDISKIETLKFAFRAGEITEEDLEAISDVNRIALNIRMMLEWQEEIQIERKD